MKINPSEFGQKQHGSTLIEILVSVFVLGFGLLALVSMQLKTVMTAREAENQTIIAQAADTLIEGMVMNPTRSLEKVGSATFLKRDYSEYVALSQAGVAPNCNNDTALSSTGTAGTNANGINKQNVARAHVCTFVKRINQIPNTGNIYWRICSEDPANAAVKPTLVGGTIQCGAVGTHAVLKVIWEQQLEDAQKYQNADIDLNATKTAALYTYQAPIAQ